MSVLLYSLLLIAILICAGGLYLFIVAVMPGFPVPEKQPMEGSDSKHPDGTAPLNRQDVRFAVKGVSVSAWMYRPAGSSPNVPCIVMASGAGGTRNMGCEPYAMRFQQAGFAVLLFDYRHFGDSDGHPRQLLKISSQLEDWTAAIAFARNQDGINPRKIALWGTSLSGGHVLVLASRDHEIACVSAQCPGLDGMASAAQIRHTMGWGCLLRLVVHGQRDLVRSWLGLSPHKVPIAGKPGTVAMATTPDAWSGYRSLAPPDFINEVCARILIRGDKYRPVTYSKHIRCTVLLQICTEDTITPKETADKAARILDHLAETKHYPIGHFDIYSGQWFRKAVDDQVTFFQAHLTPDATGR